MTTAKTATLATVSIALVIATICLYNYTAKSQYDTCMKIRHNPTTCEKILKEE